MSHRVQLTRRAYTDVDVLFAFVKRRSGVISAERWRDALFKRLSKLESTPEMWPQVDDPELEQHQLREYLFRYWRNVYRIFFRIDGEIVRIHRIRHSAQEGLMAEDI
ncbi:MAG TPA: type II toxin-antitoxin system RelE/ParE family toxin [Urbifossiella sp.]|nr:type II toxin-antitoxin system RelE/ParE family toxin [Urbifossiella sp.]